MREATAGGWGEGAVTIGELAARAGCTPEAIRYYERAGVVPRPARAGSGRYRQYVDADVERFAFLRRARELGFSLAEVQALLAFSDGDPARSCGDVDTLARGHLAQVDAKLAQLTALRAALGTVIDQCGGGVSLTNCRILGALSGSLDDARPPSPDGLSDGDDPAHGDARLDPLLGVG